MAGYSTPAWVNDTTPAINAAAAKAMGEAIEVAQHPYGVSGTTSAVAAKTVTLDVSGTVTLFTGLTVRVKFTYTNTASSPTLNVNSTGAKAIYIGGAAALPGAWRAGEVITLVYDGTHWNAANSSGAVQISATLSTSWTGSAAPYTQSISVAGVTANSIGTFDVAPTATAAQREAAREALLYVTAQGTNTMTITADGYKPTVSIPCVVTIFV